MKYLFQANFEFGHRIYQTQADESKLKPKDTDGNGGSAFTDVRLKCEAGDRLLSFELISDDMAGLQKPNEVKVDLLDGHFEMDGAELPDSFFEQSPRAMAKLAIEPLKIFYCRDYEGRRTNGQTHDVKILAYRIGWEAKNAKGKLMHVEVKLG